MVAKFFWLKNIYVSSLKNSVNLLSSIVVFCYLKTYNRNQRKATV